MGLSNYFKYGKSLESLRGAILNGNITHAYIIEGDSLIDKELPRLLPKPLCAMKSPEKDVTGAVFVDV